MMVTAEIQRGHTYYRCTKKSKAMKCPEPFAREEDLNRQLSQELEKYALPKAWAAQLSRMLNKDRQNAAQSSDILINEAQDELLGLNTKLQRLLDAYLEQDIDREAYRAEKSKIVSAKRTLDEKIIEIRKGRNIWLEQMQEWLDDAQDIGKIALKDDLSAKKSSAKNLRLEHLAFRQKIFARPEIQWAAVAAAKKIPANAGMSNTGAESRNRTEI